MLSACSDWELVYVQWVAYARVLRFAKLLHVSQLRVLFIRHEPDRPRDPYVIS